MYNDQILTFIDRVIEQDYISAEDVRCLRRDILTDGVTSQFVADALLALDRTVPSDADWTAFLTPAIVDFAVWGLRPTGVINAEIANWLLTAFSIGESTESARRILAGVAEEAQEIEPTFLLACRMGVNRRSLAA